MKPETKYKGSIKLSAIGDALGWITEFEKTPQSLKAKFGTDVIEDFYPWKKNVGGRFYGYVDSIKAGSYSDDTQLLLAVARSIKNNGDLNHDYFSKIELANWLEYSRGGGRTVKVAADKISRKSVTWFSNFYTFKVNGESFDYRRSGANGAAMRVLPIALANLGNIEKIKKEIFCNSIITHGHPRAILGAMLYGYAINQIIIYRPEDFSWENFITQIGIDFSKKFELTFIDSEEISKWLYEWNKSSKVNFQSLYEETIIETQDLLRIIYQSIKHETPVQETLKKIGCFDPNTKGSGIATVIAGIYLAAKFNNTPLQAIIEAVNALGTDTDSIAAFTGGLIGALHGHAIIPKRWEGVQDINYLNGIAEKLLAISEDRSMEESIIPNSNLKSLNKSINDDFTVNELVQFNPLGAGIITSIERQPTLTKGKYNLLVEARMEIGQTIIVSRLFDNPDTTVIEDRSEEKEILMIEARKFLKPKTLEKLSDYLLKQKRIPKSLSSLLLSLVRNDE